MVKRCQWGLCNTDDRYPERLKDGVKFIPFPKPKRKLEKCKRWIKLCGRPHDQLNVSIADGNKHLYVCTKHFVEGEPTEKYPDPLPAISTPLDARQRPARKAPNRSYEPPKKSRKILFNISSHENVSEDINIEAVSENDTDTNSCKQQPDETSKDKDKGTGCSVTLCDRNRKSLHCENSEILITNVTHWKTAETAVTAFQNFRRMCMGKRTPCDASSYCQNGGRLKVSYLCISEYVIEKRCTGEVRNISSSEGFIQSPQYPSPVFTKCQWRINIPQDSYITITIHDLETSDGSQCASGIQLKTTRNCVNYTLPSDTICKANSLSPLLACGSVTVSLVLSEKGLSKVRFWLSYKVNKFEDVPNDYLEDLASDCPEGTYAKITNRLPALEGYIQPEQPDEVTTNVTIQEKEIIQADMTEKTVFYIAVAVAAISLTGLVIVTAVCIRRQRTLKASGAAQGGRIPSRAHNASANRPLPPIFKNKPKQNGHVQDRPCLQDGYSRVADEIPYNSSQDSTRSPAYAEVDDNISPVVGRHVFRFGIHGDNRKYSSHSVENVYSELNDGKDVYYEISDNYVQQQSPGLTSSDHDQLLKGGKSVNKKQHSNSPKPEKNKRPISFEGPYSKCQASDSTRAVSKELSDSDGSLVLMDNEVYDQYQSAHV